MPIAHPCDPPHRSDNFMAESGFLQDNSGREKRERENFSSPTVIYADIVQGGGPHKKGFAGKEE